MRAFVDRIKELERKDGVLSISIVHCFPYADVPELGSRVLVVTDSNKQKADALAGQLGEELVSMRGKTMPEFFDVEKDVAAALEFNDRTNVTCSKW
jgi:microcystin degradation protein MlrC